MINNECISWKDLLEISAFLSKRRSTTARCPSELAMCWSDITCHLGSHPSHPTSFSYSMTFCISRLKLMHLEKEMEN